VSCSARLRAQRHAYSVTRRCPAMTSSWGADRRQRQLRAGRAGQIKGGRGAQHRISSAQRVPCCPRCRPLPTGSRRDYRYVVRLIVRAHARMWSPPEHRIPTRPGAADVKIIERPGMTIVGGSAEPFTAFIRSEPIAEPRWSSARDQIEYPWGPRPMRVIRNSCSRRGLTHGRPFVCRLSSDRRYLILQPIHRASVLPPDRAKRFAE